MDFIRRDELGLRTALLNAAPEALITIDEAHLTLDASERTLVAQQLTAMCQFFVLMTGTPWLGSGKANLLIPYFSQIVPFPVDVHNALVATNVMISSPFRLNVTVNFDDVVHVPWPCEDVQMRFQKFALPGRDRNVLKVRDIFCPLNLCR